MENVLACRACLATGVTLHSMHKQNLVTAYENLTGSKMVKFENLPEELCSFCKTLLIKSVLFKEKCKRAMDVLNLSLVESGMVSPTDIQNLDREYYNLTYPYVCQIQLVLFNEDFEEAKPEEDTSPKEDDLNLDNSSDCDWSAPPKLTKRPTKEKPKPRIAKDKSKATKMKDVTTTLNEPSNPPLKVERLKMRQAKQPKAEDLKELNVDMIVLSREEQIQEVLARKQSANYKNSVHKCEVCFKGFLTDVTYKNHMRRHDPSSGPYACEACHSRFPSARSLRWHVVDLHERKFSCRVCQHVARSYHGAKQHANWHNGHVFKCKMCDASFGKSSSYLTHMRLQHPSEQHCSLCGEPFLSAKGLLIHKQRAHAVNQLEQFVCSCKAIFRTLEALSHHESLKSDGVCDAGIRPCAQCGHSFENEQKLLEHMRVEHKAGASKCPKCKKTYATKTSLLAHYQRVHLKMLVGNVPRARSMKAIVCEICGRKLLSQASLVSHQRIHSGEKPFQCSECPKKFRIVELLENHMRTHTGERPFKCATCPKAFKLQSALHRHKRVHTGLKPYCCVHCGKSFTQSNSMKLHVKTVHFKMPPPKRKRKDDVKNES